MTEILWAIIACGLLACVYAAVTIRNVMAADAGNARMQEIAGAVREGAQAYLDRQYRTIGIVGVAIFVLAWVLLGPAVAVGFLIGAVLSGLAGLALLGVAVYFFILTHTLGYEPGSRQVIDALVALGFGASLISIFARLGGGIFTKGADVGGDLVGKVEAGIPEDDPRNPATIADNVGDNVGDCAGMAADLFETYAVTVVATMVLAAILFAGQANLVPLMIYPLAICAACIVTSIIGTYFVKLGPNGSIMGALYKGFIASAVLSVGGLWLATQYVLGGYGSVGTARGLDITGLNLMLCGLVGLGVTGLIVWITEY
jgi:K(+)-stimulated pyrophosphate-energized sodium pump